MHTEQYALFVVGHRMRNNGQPGTPLAETAITPLRVKRTVTSVLPTRPSYHVRLKQRHPRDTSGLANCLPGGYRRSALRGDVLHAHVRVFSVPVRPSGTHLSPVCMASPSINCIGTSSGSLLTTAMSRS